MKTLLFYKEYTAKNISIPANNYEMPNVPAVPIDGYERTLVSFPSCKNSASGGVNASFISPWYAAFTASGLTVGVRNSGRSAAKIDITVRVLYVRNGYYGS